MVSLQVPSINLTYKKIRTLYFLINLLNDTNQQFLISRNREKIKSIAGDNERSLFFNKILASRKLITRNQRIIASTLKEAINIAATTKKEDIDSELKWYRDVNDYSERLPNYSSLVNIANLVSYKA